MENVPMFPIDNPTPIDINELLVETKQDIVYEDVPQWLVDASEICGQTLTLDSFQINVDNSGNILDSSAIPLTPEEIAAQHAILEAEKAIQESLAASQNVAILQ